MQDPEIYKWEEEGGQVTEPMPDWMEEREESIPPEFPVTPSQMGEIEYDLGHSSGVLDLIKERVKVVGEEVLATCPYKCEKCKSILCSTCIGCCYIWASKRDAAKTEFEKLRDEYISSYHVRENLESAFKPDKDAFELITQNAQKAFNKQMAKTISAIEEASKIEKEKELALRKQMLEYGKLSGLKTLSPGAIVTTSTRTVITDDKAALAFCKENKVCLVVDSKKLIDLIESEAYDSDVTDTFSKFETTNNTKLEKKLTGE